MSEFDDPALVGLGLALASGLLIGLERGWQQRERPEDIASRAFAPLR